jgi:hypothetical protein
MANHGHSLWPDICGPYVVNGCPDTASDSRTHGTSNEFWNEALNVIVNCACQHGLGCAKRRT